MRFARQNLILFARSDRVRSDLGARQSDKVMRDSAKTRAASDSDKDTSKTSFKGALATDSQFG